MGAGDRGARGRRSSTSASRRWSQRIARMPLNQLQMMKLLVNQSLVRAGARTRPRCSGRCSTGSRATRRRATRSSGCARAEGLPRGGPRSATSRSATSGRSTQGIEPIAASRPGERLLARRPGADRGGRLRGRVGGGDRRAGGGRGGHAVPPLRLQAGAVRRGVPRRSARARSGRCGRRPRRLAGRAAVERLEQVLATFAERALRNPRLAWALIAEPVDPLVDAERLAYRERYAAVIAEELRAGIDAGELPDAERRADRGGARRRLRRGARRTALAGGRRAARRARRSSPRCGRSCAGRSGRVDERGRPGRARRAGVHGAALAARAPQRGRRRDRGSAGRRVPGVRRRRATRRSPCCTARAACSAPEPT